MGTIQDYPVATTLDGSELIAVFKGGRQMALPPGLLANPLPGTPGLSAYQLWLLEGNVGTLANFLASLQGPPGPPAGTDGLVSISSLASQTGALGIGTTFGTSVEEQLRLSQPRQPVTPFATSIGTIQAAAGRLDAHFYDPQAKSVRPTYGGGANQLGLVIPSTDTSSVPALWTRHSLTNLWYARWQHGQAIYRQRILDDYHYVTTTLFTEPGILTGGSGHYAPTGVSTSLVSTFDDACWLAQYHEQAAIAGDPNAPIYLVDTITSALAMFMAGADAANPVIALLPNAPNLTNINYGLGSYNDPQTGVSRYYGPPVQTSTYGSRYTLPSNSNYTGVYGDQSSSFELHMGLCALTAYRLFGYPFMLTYAQHAQDFARNNLLTPDPTITPNDPAHTPASPAGRKAQYLVEVGFRLSTATASNDPYQVKFRPDKQWYGRPLRNEDSTSIGGAFAFCLLSARLYRLLGSDQYRLDAINTAQAIISTQGYGRASNGATILELTRDPHSDGHLAYPFVAEVLTLPGMPQPVRDAFLATGNAIATGCVNLSTGYASADWAGPESDGTYATWEAAYAANGTYAGGVQIMTSAETLSMLHACAAQAELVSGPAQAGIVPSPMPNTLDQILAQIEVNGVLGYRMKKALLDAGVYDAVALSRNPVADEFTIRWDGGAPVVPGDIVATTIQSAIGYTAVQMAALFAAAALVP